MYDYTRSRAISRSKWEILVAIYGTTCAYCHQNYATQIDHVIPISWKHSNDISNLRPCCAWCNLHASDNVFETFDDKYEWLRKERKRKRFGSQKRTVCTVCKLPYQRPLHSPNLFLCAECYDHEYDKMLRMRPQWVAWIELCQRAGFVIEAHRDLAKWHHSLRGTSVTPHQRATKLAECYAVYQEWEIEGLTVLRDEPSIYCASGAEEALFG